MTTCKDCRWWERNGTRLDELGRPYDEVCQAYNFGTCSNEHIIYGYAPSFKEERGLLVYEDIEGYEATLQTQESFGCIHFEEKNND